MNVPGMDLSTARITWEARDQEPAFGPTFTYAPKNNGVQWVEGEAQWPDGRRAFATATFNVNAPNVVWFDDALPTGAISASDGGDSWNWVSSNPAPNSGTVAHQSAVATGSHQHLFSGAIATLAVGTGDILYAWVYLDPANPPTEIMLQWATGSVSAPDWGHRAYWGANSLGYGSDGSNSRRYMGPLPARGQWVQLKVPASQVGLEGSTLTGMAFTLFGGRATWDAAGRLSASSGTPVPVPASLRVTTAGATLTWPSVSGSLYSVSYKNNLTDPTWVPATPTPITATGAISSWTDPTSRQAPQRFYKVTQLGQ
jgi:hypothetical protein